MSEENTNKPIYVDLWGPTKKNANVIKHHKIPKPPREPGLGYIFMVFLTIIGFGIALVLYAVWNVFLHYHNIRVDPQGFSNAVSDYLTKTGFGITLSIAIMWPSLFVPVFLAGKRLTGQWNGWTKIASIKFKWIDITIAIVFTLFFRILEGLVDTLLKNIWHLDPSKLGNGSILTSAGHNWLIVMGLLASIGAPFFEELFFRGLVLRVLRVKMKLHPMVALTFTSLGFGLLHAQGTIAGSIYTCTSTFIVGFGLGLLMLKTNRLGTSMTSHAFFNGSAALLSF
jgi:membrane protease YdiL (CAAX protease family)